jgi:hypothetical protein
MADRIMMVIAVTTMEVRGTTRGVNEPFVIMHA